jgi:cobalt-precorrin-5B (C1)-methyltransferase
VLTALAALEGLERAELEALHGAPTVEEALAGLALGAPQLAERLKARIAAAVEQRSAAYLARYGQTAMAVGAVLFDRSRQLAARGPLGAVLLAELAGSGAAVSGEVAEVGA